MDVDVVRSPRVWILVADAKQAQIYVPKLITHHIPMAGNPIHRHWSERQEHVLEPLLSQPMMAKSKEDYQTGRNQTGMVFESYSSARHMASPHIDVRDEIRKHFARQIADYFAGHQTSDSFDDLILVAPPKMLGDIDAYLTDQIRKKVIAKLPKELTHETPQSLAEHLEAFF